MLPRKGGATPLNLCFTLPDQEAGLIKPLRHGKPLRYCVPYDLNDDGGLCGDGWIAVTEDTLFVLKGGALKHQVFLAEADEVLCTPQVNSGVLAVRRKGDEIIEQANSSADDIYAASVIYTADAIGRIRDLMDQTNDSMNDLFRQFRKELKEQKDVLKSHESELQAQLEGTENRITEARKRYNQAVQDYNVLIRSFPNNLFAGMFGFSRKEKFEASTGAEEAPKVEF